MNATLLCELSPGWFIGGLATAIGLVVYVYVLFPLVLFLRATFRARPWREASTTEPLSVIIVAHNEAAVIGKKLDNLLSEDYPRDQIEIIVASDGSTDETNAIVARYASQGVELLRLPRAGKIPALNAAVAKTRGTLVVFTDANSMFARDALRELVRPFADPSVGGVAGDQRYVARNLDGSKGECSYWNLDRLLKRWGSAAGNATSATGAIHAVRRELLDDVPNDVTDDFMISTGVIAKGLRLVFNERAIAYEEPAGTATNEFGRKVRVITRGLRGVMARRELLDVRRYGFTSLQLLSHKVLRRLVVVPLLGMFVFSGLLWPLGWEYRVAFMAQTLFYALAAVGLCVRGTALQDHKLIALPFFFCMVNTAALVATINCLLGRRIQQWQPHREKALAEVHTMAVQTPRQESKIGG